MKFLFLVFMLPFALLGQESPRKLYREVEQRFLFRHGDSTQLHLKETIFDTAGSLISRSFYEYDPQERGVLIREELAQYLPSRKIFEETFRQYYPGREPVTRYRSSQYLEYAPKMDSSKPVLVQEFDEYREPTKEDTFQYNDLGLLKTHCQYNYNGSTSLFCDEYRYNKQGKKTEWRTYAKWTTIKRKGKPVYKQALRRKYKFYYNNKGQHTKSKGYYYKSKLTQVLSYHASGKTQEDKTVVERKLRQSKKKRKETGKKYSEEREERLMRYDTLGNLLLHEVKSLDGEQVREVWTYDEKGNPTFMERYEKGKRIEHQTWEYNENQVLKVKKLYKYKADGNVQHEMHSFADEKGRIVREEQRSNERLISSRTMYYDAENRLLERSLFLSTGEKFEKIAYFYTYYEQGQ